MHKDTNMKKLFLLITGLLLLFSVEGQILRYSNYTAPTPPEEPLAEDFEVDRYISGLSTPLHDSVESKLRDFVVALKDSLNIDSLAQVFDVIQIYANGNSEAALRNLVNRTHDATAVSSPTFTAFEGYSFNGTSNYLNTDYNPREDSVNVSRSAFTFGIYSKTAPTGTSSSKNHGVYDTGAGTGSRICVNPARSTDLARVYPCNVAVPQTAFTGSVGMLSVVRSASNASYAVANKTFGTVDTGAPQPLPNYNMYIGATNSGDTAAEFITGTIALFFIGSSLTSDELSDLIDCFEAYMDSNGEGVIE